MTRHSVLMRGCQEVARTQTQQVQYWASKRAQGAVNVYPCWALLAVLHVKAPAPGSASASHAHHGQVFDAQGQESYSSESMLSNDPKCTWLHLVLVTWWATKPWGRRPKTVIPANPYVLLQCAVLSRPPTMKYLP